MKLYSPTIADIETVDKLAKTIFAVTDPMNVLTKSAVFVPREAVQEMERAMFELGRRGFWEWLREEMDSGQGPTAAPSPTVQLINELCKLAALATPSGMGGTPDLFAPNYTDEQIKETDSVDAWDCHECYVRRAIQKSSEMLKGGDIV